MSTLSYSMMQSWLSGICEGYRALETAGGRTRGASVFLPGIIPAVLEPLSAGSGVRPEEAQFTQVAGECLAPCGEAGVTDAELLACRSNDRGEPRVIQVADVRQQVMLDLVIQSTDVKIQQLVMRRKVGGGLD